MNIQLFAEGGEGSGGTGGSAGSGNGQNQQNNQNQQAQGVQIDYARIQQMLDGTLAAKEDTALKAYFKQQGLSQQEAEQAMAAFKQQKAANTPDVNAMQEQLTQAQAAADQSRLENAAILQAIQLGLDAKTIPYILKLTDLSQVTGQDGKINEETLKAELNKVLEALPGLKPQAKQATGFQVGAPGGNQQQNSSQNDQLAAIFGNKK
jgi:hypothetical protein